MCFSHTHKGQSHNMPILQAFLDKKAGLIDYELLTDSNNKRLVAFGSFAGYAGFINALHGLGDRLLDFGLRTPFINVGLAHQYIDLAEAKAGRCCCRRAAEELSVPRIHCTTRLCLYRQWKRLPRGPRDIQAAPPSICQTL